MPYCFLLSKPKVKNVFFLMDEFNVEKKIEEEEDERKKKLMVILRQMSKHPKVTLKASQNPKPKYMSL